jgi:hypothetical protein
MDQVGGGGGGGGGGTAQAAAVKSDVVADGAHGAAVALAGQAVQIAADALAEGDRFDVCDPESRSALAAEHERCRQALALAEGSNRMIGMEPVPRGAAALATWMPTAKSVLKPTPFEMPPPAFTRLEGSV